MISGINASRAVASGLPDTAICFIVGTYRVPVLMELWALRSLQFTGTYHVYKGPAALRAEDQGI